MAFAASLLAPAVSNGEVILIVVLVSIPVAAIVFIANAGSNFRSIGKGGLSVEFESDLPQGMRDSGAEAEPAGAREDELRQMLEAKAYRQSARGETPLDVDQELAKLLAERAGGPVEQRSRAARGGAPARRRAQRAPRPPGQGAARGRGRGRATAAGAGEPGPVAGSLLA